MPGPRTGEGQCFYQKKKTKNQKTKNNNNKEQRKLALLLEHKTTESLLEVKPMLSNSYSNECAPRSCRVTEPQPLSGCDGAGGRSAAGPCPPAGSASMTAPPWSAAPALSFPARPSVESQEPAPPPAGLPRAVTLCTGKLSCPKRFSLTEEPFCSVNNCFIYNWLQGFTFFLERWTYEEVIANHILPRERGFVLRSEPSVGGSLPSSPAARS